MAGIALARYRGNGWKASVPTAGLRRKLIVGGRFHEAGNFSYMAHNSMLNVPCNHNSDWRDNAKCALLGYTRREAFHFTVSFVYVHINTLLISIFLISG